MASATQGNTQTGSTLKAFEDKIKAQVGDAKSKLDQLEARAREKRAEAEATTINGLNATKQNIDRKLQDLKATHDAHVAHAKSDIESDVAKFKASVDELGAKFKTTRK
jgi:hypothetical protein